MNEIPLLGRFLILAGFSIALLGAFLTLGGQLPFLGKLPGDIVIHRGNATFVFPLATSLLLSLILTVLLRLFRG